MNTLFFLEALKSAGINFFCGIPDSLLKYLQVQINNDKTLINIVTANEGSAIGLAAGYHISSKNFPCVYLQNSGLGNILNPLVSLASKAVYNIPMLLLIGWRGEIGLKDEPQHQFQGEITPKLLNILDIKYYEISKETTNSEFLKIVEEALLYLRKNQRVAFLIKKDIFEKVTSLSYINDKLPTRESAIKVIVDNIEFDSPIVSTTGKISRELYEILHKINLNPSRAFFVVGSMGHASMIALGISYSKTNKKVYCFDGDGAAIMHLGSMATIGSINPPNFCHIILNNFSHESVGGMSTTNVNLNFRSIAKSCGYTHTHLVTNEVELILALSRMKNQTGLTLLEIQVNKFSRDDLIRPIESPNENKLKFMDFLSNNT